MHIDDTTFRDRIHNAARGGEQWVADLLSVSMPTIRRWSGGGNLPYQAMRKPIMQALDVDLI